MIMEEEGRGGQKIGFVINVRTTPNHGIYFYAIFKLKFEEYYFVIANRARIIFHLILLLNFSQRKSILNSRLQ